VLIPRFGTFAHQRFKSFDFDLADVLAALRRRGCAVEDECRLLAADQLDIDFGQQLRIEQGAMLGAPCVVDAVAPAERVERIGGHRVFAARQRLDDTAIVDDRMTQPPEFDIEEAGGATGIYIEGA
jgi:hypothetical protein